MKLYACINYNFVIAGGVGVITTIIAGIVGALLAFVTARRCAKIGEKSNTYSFQVHVWFRFLQYGRQYMYMSWTQSTLIHLLDEFNETN